MVGKHGFHDRCAFCVCHLIVLIIETPDDTSILIDVERMEVTGTRWKCSALMCTACDSHLRQVGFENLDWAVPSIDMLRAALRGLVLQPEVPKGIYPAVDLWFHHDQY